MNLAVKGVKGAVAMMRDCWGWDIWDDLGTGASVTVSIVVVSTAGASVVSSFPDESLAAIRTSSDS